MATHKTSTRILRTVVVGELLVRLLATPLACERSAPAPVTALRAAAASDGREQPADPRSSPAKGDAEQPTEVVFKDVKVFDGKSHALTGSTTVLIVGNQIAKIGGDPAVPANATVVDGNGRTLMPGLIDAHWHAMLVRPTATEALAWDVGYANLVAGAEARNTLLRGFTTVRDMGGPVFGLKRAIDEGVIAGPRIYPSGAMITVTGGHGDFRQTVRAAPHSRTARRTRMEQIGGSMIADSPDEVRVRVREQLMLGASQIKLTAGGGVASPHSPLDVTTFTEPELRAAVEAAENWGTYVTVHAYTPAAIERAISAGVKCIEHGHLMDEDTARLIAKRGSLVEHPAVPRRAGRRVSARLVGARRSSRR